MAIIGTVGFGGRNAPADVKLVQQLLQKNGFPQLQADGMFGPKTLHAIKSFQAKFMRNPDGLINLNGRTWRNLAGLGSSNVKPIPQPSQPTQTSFPQPEGPRNFSSGRLTVKEGQLTFNAEGNDMLSSIYFSRRIHWPGGVSGVTIGRGYDMGGRTANVIYQDMIRVGIPAEQAQLLSEGAKLTGTSAQRFVKRHVESCGIITREEQARLFELIYPGYASSARMVYLNKTSAFPTRTPWENLHPAIKELVVDFVYQGMGWERVMKSCMTNDIPSLIKYIQETAEVSRYEKGRHRADYLKKFL
ncbi:peptidoglycan-binding protein [Franconibacter helveticus]|uniref:peptidoglycan-binding protein n=1 Tax=Franconibacter helveticus TaxID=357240 RepID=UPI000DA12BA4|nr:peptidoglycan-binding protein [Franconibacter helveticus]